jgi:hypothetical protein
MYQLNVLSRPSIGVTYIDVIWTANWIYLLRLRPQQITVSPLQLSLPRSLSSGIQPNTSEYCFFYSSMGLDLSQVHYYCGHQPLTIYGDDCGTISGINGWQEKPNGSEETCQSADFSARGSTWLDSGSNVGRRGGKRRLIDWSMARPSTT